VVHALARQVADALVECEDADQLLAAVGVDGALALRPDEAAEAAALLHQACGGDPDAASPLAAAVCRALAARVAGRSPLQRLGERLLAAVVAQMEDSGWRLRSAHARPGGRGADEVTCLLHVTSRALVQVRHGTRRAHFQFRAAAGSEVMGCDCSGAVEAGTLLAVEAVRELEDPRGRGRRVPADGLGQVGEWQTRAQRCTCIHFRSCVRTSCSHSPSVLHTRICMRVSYRSVSDRISVFYIRVLVSCSQVGEWQTRAQRGRLVWTNGGSALHMLRGGGFVFLPSRDGARALLLEDGWARAIARHDAVARLMLAPA
jgi:hypothetical protein